MIRYHYLKKENLEKLLEDKSTLMNLAEKLEVPNQAKFKTKDLNEVRAAIDLQIEFYRRTESSFWHGCENNEILAAAIWDSMGDKKRWSHFYDVGQGNESNLRGPVAHWLENNGLHYKFEIPISTKRADVVGYYNYNGVKRVLSIELKNDLVQLERGLDQLMTYQEYSNAVYLAVTPFVASEYQEKYSSANKKHHPGALESKLRKVNIGLLLVEGENVEVCVHPNEQKIQDEKFNIIIEAIRRRTLSEC